MKKRMRKLFWTSISLAAALAALAPFEPVSAQRRVVVRPGRAVVRRPAIRSRLVVRAGHPIRRVLPAQVVVRPARKVVAVGAPLFFLPAIAWRPAGATLPSGERLIWQDAESIENEDGWVDTNFGVDSTGHELYLAINGAARLNFAEIAFASGQVQVVDFDESAHRSGVYRLLDFGDGRHVKTIRILAKSEAGTSKLIVYLSKN